MEDLKNLQRIVISSLLLIMLTTCGHKNGHSNSVYIDIYGRCKEQITVKLDDDIIFDKKMKAEKLLEVTRGPLILKKEKVKIYYRIDDKDTSFTFVLKQNNYLSIGYSEFRKEFQFGIRDSLHFFKSRID